MTFDLEAAKRLAQQLAGDVLAQIEKDGSINRGNIAGQLLAGLVLEAAREGMKDRLFTQAGQAVPSPIGGLQSLIAEGPWPAAPSTGPGGDDRAVTLPNEAEIGDEVIIVNPGANAGVIYPPSGETINGNSAFFVTDAAGLEAVHINCPCAECKRRRKLSLCCCEMCMHHSEAAAIIADKRSSVWKLWRMENGERVNVVPSESNVWYLRRALENGAPIEVVDHDIWFFPNGRVMTGLELVRAGRSASSLWEEMRRLDAAQAEMRRKP